MPRDKKQELSPILQLAKPEKKTRFRVTVIQGIAIMEGENGAIAAVPVNEVCRLAERLNLIIEGYRC